MTRAKDISKIVTDANFGGTLDVTGDLTVDTNTLYVDSANNRVGVGTVSPSFGFEYVNSSPILQIKDSNSTGNAANPYVRMVDSADTFMGAVGFASAATGEFYVLNASANPISFYTNNTERMRLDSSGNLLVAKTTLDYDTPTGHVLRADGFYSSVRSGGNCVDFNRLSSDGEIIRVSRDGADVGSIGSSSGRLYIGSLEGSDSFIRFNSNEVVPSTSAGAARDNAINLGASAARFKDLYLSGGVYLGGTGSANYLDDYEEGTYTPTVASTGTNPTVTYLIQEGNYTKVGRQVTVTGEIRFSAFTSNGGSLRLEGLPFSVFGDTNYRAVGSVMVDSVATNLTGDYTNLQLAYNSGTSGQIIMNNSVTGGAAETPVANIDSGTIIRYQITYIVA